MSCKHNQKLTMEIRLSGVGQLQKKASVTTPALFLGECVLAFALGYFWKKGRTHLYLKRQHLCSRDLQIDRVMRFLL